jgi:signal transduction histidine kinase
MAGSDAAFVATAGAVFLALAVTVWALMVRRREDVRVRRLQRRLAALELSAEAAQAGAEAFDSAVVILEDGAARLASGEDSLQLCAEALGAAADPAAAVEALAASSPEHARRLSALTERGEPLAFEVRGPKGSVMVEGRTAGVFAWLRLSPAIETELPTASRFAAVLDGLETPAWITGADRRLRWANRAWLKAVGAATVDEAVERRLGFDQGADAATAEAAGAGARREFVRWIAVEGQRRAFRVVAEPLDGGGAAGWALDVTEAEESRETLKRHVEAHDETLNHLADAVAIFDSAKRLSFHNTAFAELWGLEPAWLAERPSHAEVLDRLRQRRRLPETVDYGVWRARELGFYETLDAPPDELWSLPDSRTLRVVRQPHPLGGLLLLFADITGEVRLKAQYNSLIKVQQATLDKLNDGVAVFGSDGRLRLHNEAFERFWNIPHEGMAAGVDFDKVAELCVPLLHDMQFWRDLKARVADPDPQARAAISGEARTSDRRVIAFQTRPLPDGATLIAFTDVTATRELEGALANQERALAEAERLKRDFVGNVSYELRTPLTTIIGYSELLDRQGSALPDRARGHLAAVRTAAAQLARSIDDVLDMAMMDAGEMALTLGDVDVLQLMNTAREKAMREADQSEVAIEITAEPGVGVIRADARRLGQVLDHLMENALRSTPPGGTVRLKARHTFGEVQISVEDNGRGIPFHVQAHIFDRFTSRDRGGPGLGLALVKALVELHGGWVALESEPGAGATFICHLPERAFGGAAAPELQLGAA